MSTEQVTPEDREKLQQVANSGAAAAASAPAGEETEAAKRAMRDKAQEVKLDIPPEQIDAIATLFVDKAIAEMDARGAFSPPPEPVRPPEQPPTAPPPPGEPAQAPPGSEPEQPHQKNFAQRWMGA